MTHQMLRGMCESNFFRSSADLKALFDLGFTYPNRPMTSNTYLPYQLLQAINPSSFYVEITDLFSDGLKANIKEALEGFKVGLIRFQIGCADLHDLWEQMPVVVADRDFATYLRAEVNFVDVERKMVNVTLVDTGAEACLTGDSVFLPSIDLIRYPKLAILCRMSQIVPSCGNAKWPEEDYTRMLTGSVSSLVSIQEMNRGVADVYLDCDDIDVGLKMMVQSGLAEPVPLKPQDISPLHVGKYPIYDFSDWVGLKIPVYGIKVLSYCEVAMQLAAVKVNEIMEDIAAYVKETPDFDRLPFKKEIGSPCLAPYEGVDFYRATIIEKLENGYFVLKYVDYWDFDIVKESEMIKIPDKFLCLPEGSTLCKLLDFLKSRPDPILFIDQLKEMVEYKDLYCRIELSELLQAGVNGTKIVGVVLSQPIDVEQEVDGKDVELSKIMGLDMIPLSQNLLRCNPILSNEVADRLLNGPSDYFPDTKYTGVLSCAENEQSVWLQLGRNGEKADLLAEEMTEFYSNWKGPVLTHEMITDGTYVVCQQQDDRRWYRAKVTSIHRDRNLYYVLFLDYGNYDYASLTSMKPLVDYFGKDKCLALQVALPVVLKAAVDLDDLSEFILNFCEDGALTVWLQHVEQFNYAWIVKEGILLADELLKKGFVDHFTFEPTLNLRA